MIIGDLKEITHVSFLFFNQHQFIGACNVLVVIMEGAFRFTTDKFKSSAQEANMKVNRYNLSRKYR